MEAARTWQSGEVLVSSASNSGPAFHRGSAWLSACVLLTWAPSAVLRQRYSSDAAAGAAQMGRVVREQLLLPCLCAIIPFCL